MAFAIAVSASVMQGRAQAVVINTLTGVGNTSAPADDPGWANVGALNAGTGVYLGNDWVLTSARVGGGSIVLNGGTYAMLAGSGTTLTNQGAPGKTATTDLYMFRLASTPQGLAGVTIASGSAAPGISVTMIGSGRDRGAFTEWSVDYGTTPWSWTEVPSGGNAAGYQTLDSRSMRWGENTVNASGIWLADGFGDVRVLATEFNASGSPSNEAQAVSGDFGGAVFHKNGSAWELSGIMVAVAGYSGQPDPEANAIYGDVTYVADLSFYRSEIVAIVPEPSAVVMLAAAVGSLAIGAAWRRRAGSRSSQHGRRAVGVGGAAEPDHSFRFPRPRRC